MRDVWTGDKAPEVVSVLPRERKKASVLPRLDMKTPEATRRTIARLIRKHAAGELDEQLFKSTLYGLQQLLAWWRFCKDLDLEARLDELEKRLNV